MESLEIVLERAQKEYSNEEKIEMATRKNNYYVEKIKSLTKSAILDGALEFIDMAKSSGLKVAIGSSSKNTMAILKQVECDEIFDAIADGNDIKNSKPAPDVFLVAAEKLGLYPKDCMVVEDAYAGVDAAISAGMDVLAVGYASTYERATYSSKSLGELI